MGRVLIGSLLIANRGEIARRIIRTARRLGARTVAVYSEADSNAPHVREADAAVAIGPPPARESYLNAAAILAAARETGAEAIHPGYGFLSENADFAEAVRAAGLVWIGPPPAAIRAMGLKDAAKRLMAEAGVPVTPGYLGDDQSPDTLAAEAAQIGFPVLIKAVAGGGGKGMRAVERAEDFAASLDAARREAASSFGDERVLLERLVTRPRHIEVQVFGDAHGNVVHLFERDCSLQRRRQKVIEEAPAPGMDAATRAAVTDAAVRAARAVGYQNAGTIEFIADASEGLRPDRIWFMEMNTRLQVEHPVTEAVTGLDLVEWQLRVASGEPLPLTQDQITLSGHAIEARLYAEDPAKGFLPSVGRLDHLKLPKSVRVDSGVEPGGEVSAFYDPMIAKLVAHAETREAALARLAGACGEVEAWPATTNAAFLSRLLSAPEVREAKLDTGLVERRLDELTSRPSALPELFAAGAAIVAAGAKWEWGNGASLWDSAPPLFGFRMGAPAAVPITLRTSDQVLTVRVSPDPDSSGWVWRAEVAGQLWRFDYEWPTRGRTGVVRDIEGGERFQFCLQPGGPYPVLFDGGATFAMQPARSTHAGEAEAGDGQILAPMPGRIAAVAVKVGEAVARGQTVVALEAMKMEHALVAPFDASVAEVRCAVGDQVTEGALLVRLEPRG